MTELETLLVEVERAAWARSWSQLQRARKALKRATGLDLRGDPSVPEAPDPVVPHHALRLHLEVE